MAALDILTRPQGEFDGARIAPLIDAARIIVLAAAIRATFLAITGALFGVRFS